MGIVSKCKKQINNSTNSKVSPNFLTILWQVCHELFPSLKRGKGVFLWYIFGEVHASLKRAVSSYFSCPPRDHILLTFLKMCGGNLDKLNQTSYGERRFKYYEYYANSSWTQIFYKISMKWKFNSKLKILWISVVCTQSVWT